MSSSATGTGRAHHELRNLMKQNNPYSKQSLHMKVQTEGPGTPATRLEMNGSISNDTKQVHAVLKKRGQEFVDLI